MTDHATALRALLAKAISIRKPLPAYADWSMRPHGADRAAVVAILKPERWSSK